MGAGLRGPSQGQTSNADLMQHLWQMSQQHLVSVRLSLGRASLRLVRSSRVPAKVELDELNLAWHAGIGDGRWRIADSSLITVCCMGTLRVPCI